MNNSGGQILIRILCILFGVLLNSVIVHLILTLSVYCAILIKEYMAYLYFWLTSVAVVNSVYCTKETGCRSFHWSEKLQVIVTAIFVGCTIIIINTYLILLFCITVVQIRIDMYQLFRMMN